MNKHIDVRNMPIELDRMMDEADRERTRFVVGRDGKPAGILMGLRDYLDTFPAPAWLEASWTQAKEGGLDTMTIDEIDAEVALAGR